MATVKRQVTITSEKYGNVIASLKDATNALTEELDNSGEVSGTPTFEVTPAKRYGYSKVRIVLRTETDVSE